MQAELKRNRRIYTLKDDDALFSALARYTFATPAQLSQITGRKLDTLQHRLKVLFESHYVNRVRLTDELSLREPYVYFLDREGAQRACDLGELSEPHYILSKSRLIVNHDLEITNFHLALEIATFEHAYQNGKGPSLNHWRQWRDELKDKVETDQGMKAIIPDAYFTLGDQAYFLEIVKSYESEYVGGRSNIEQKLSLYRRYASNGVHAMSRFQEKYGGGDFRVLWVLPTQKRVAMLLGKIETEFPYRKFWFTDEASYKAKLLDKIWWTPKDFRTATYSIFEQTG